MLWSTERHRAISGWLEHNDPASFNDALKLQKYLFFYEVTALRQGDPDVDFSHLSGYVNGPVFSNVYGDYRHDGVEFANSALENYKKHKDMIDEKNATKAAFMVSIMNDEELSEFTHQFHVWKARKADINAREFQVSLSESDISSDDFNLLSEVYQSYSDDEIKNSIVIPKGQLKFLMSTEDGARITPDQEGVLETVANMYSDEFDNPVYVTIAEDGALEFD